MKKTLTVLAVIIVVGLIAVGTWRWVNDEGVIPGQEPGEPGGPAATGPAQPDWCPAVEVIAAPGTWESSPTDDPINPSFNPNSFMLTVTRPLQDRYPADRVKVWTLPYTAQFRNINADQEMTYDESRSEGTSSLENELRVTHRDCPLTDFIMTGFSQGAVIVGDIASEIGNGHGAVPAERVRGVALVADGRREPGVGQAVGNPVSGVGAEISLELLNPAVQLVTPGATMRGPRDSGFGALDDRTFQICAPDDHICDAPLGVGNAVERAQGLIENNGVHARYATNPNVFPGSTTSRWLVGWSSDLIDRIPDPGQAPASGVVTSVPPVP
ncbi:cutinase family protein [Corynebacterium pygosceleis]|uniref:Cutinase family protein n=1 Tax=Corynebacterium pygosceleis TaxID=2800406 RepID=A0A9Q4GIZ2_9CORY|nr:cutinase family protein [Corynebacterium pygosceleis]MCK7638257.1 PE-PPE domain-containing protein [Corynebacterium pygosceleis]MCL0121369.1 PE-PPE domain-containing protein [Corynebacterium pygosceleis]MCX7468918.1 cutinase family protein [Corynebacterium pygosceleis]